MATQLPDPPPVDQSLRSTGSEPPLLATKVIVPGCVPGVGALLSRNTPIKNITRPVKVIPEIPVFEVIAVPLVPNGFATPSGPTFGSDALDPYLTVPVMLLKLISPPGVMAIPCGNNPMFAPTDVPAVPKPASKILSIAPTVTVMANNELETNAITPAPIKSLFIAQDLLRIHSIQTLQNKCCLNKCQEKNCRSRGLKSGVKHLVIKEITAALPRSLRNPFTLPVRPQVKNT